MAIDPLSLDFGRDKPWCVYLYRDPRKRQEVIYVGKGNTQTRPDSHWTHGSHNIGLKEALRDIKEAGAEPIIEYVGFFDDQAGTLKLELSLIKRFGRRADGGILHNISPGRSNTRLPREKRKLNVFGQWFAQRSQKAIAEPGRAMIRAAAMTRYFIILSLYAIARVGE